MASTVKVGIIGTGGISRAHAMAYQRVPNVEIVAVADIMPERAERAAQDWGVSRWFGNVQQLLEQDLDAVSVCTFNQAHREPTVAALKAGKHVLLEKPMAANLDDAIAMMRAAKQSGTIFHVGFWPRWQPEIQAAKRMVESGALGDLYYAQMVGGGRRRIPPGSFLRKAFAGAGPTVDIGCYDLDTFVFLAGAPRPLSVSAMVSYRLGKHLPNVPGDWGHDPTQVEVEDMGTAFVRFEGGLVLHFTTYWAAHADDLGPSLLLGTKGGLQLTPKLTLFRDEFGVLTNVAPQIP
ncbi:MAG: Gfo/Idh/MocA family oxidoreductase, partial [Chloroflexales bacterium]|nr:Gfo/Idh/MocA family oxidoreductase [Chloroflexales bacterium]